MTQEESNKSFEDFMNNPEARKKAKEEREFSEAVERYRRTVFGAKTDKERLKAISKFRCGRW